MTHIVEAVKTALKHEVRTEALFRRAARLTTKDDSRELLNNLAAREVLHLKQLTDQVDRSPLGRVFDAADYVSWLEAVLDAPVPRDDDQVATEGNVGELIRRAERRQTDARDDLLWVAWQAEEPMVKVFFTELSALDEAHLDELKRVERRIGSA